MPPSQTRPGQRLSAPLASAGPVAFDTLKLSHAEWIEIVEHIKRIGAQQRDGATQRQHARAEALGLLQLVIEVSQPGGTDMRLIARSHDLSANGLGFIHGMYLYPGSAVTCWLRHAAKGLTPIPGAIRWCRHIKGRVHLSGVQLDEVIRVADFMPCGADDDV
ncbi:MAG: PilZ domain-containing protein [Phycisphaeraceae bacterium]